MNKLPVIAAACLLIAAQPAETGILSALLGGAVGAVTGHSIGKSQGVKAALRTLEERCDSENDAKACTRAAICYLQGEMRTKTESFPIEKDHQKAERLFKRGCSLGEPTACQVVRDLYP